MATENSMRQFLAWLRVNDPFLYEVALKGGDILQREKEANAQMGDYSLGFSWGDLASGIGDAFKTAASTVKDILPAYAQYKSQSKILKMQMERAQQGLPPLETEYYTPTVKVAPEVTPKTEAAINRVAQNAVRQVTAQTGAGLKKYILPISLAAGGLALFFILRKR